MLSSKPRSGSSEMAQKNSPSPPNLKPSPSKTAKGTPVSSDSSDSKPSKPIERKPSTKTTSLPEKRIVRVSEMQQQLGQFQEELKKAKEDRSRALEELEEVKKRMLSQKNVKEGSSQSKTRIEILQVEVEKAKESERKMLESMVSQTKQLEETKIALEEAKLEIRSLQESIKSLHGSAGRSSRNLDTHLEKHGATDLVHGQEEIGVLRNELKLATQAEEKSKKAMDDLALALKEVTMEANQVKEKLSKTQSELENGRADAERSKDLLKSMEEKFRVTFEESDRLKMEAEESTAAWNEKEKVFINCMKVSDEEITKLKQENNKLIDLQKLSREEISKLRDILKQAVNEATIVKEALEIARNENYQLKDTLSEKDNALQSIKQEYECLKVSEAASVGSVRELKSLLAATSTMDLSKSASSFETASYRQPKATVNDVKDSKRIAKFPTENWKGDNPRIQNGRKYSLGEPGKFKGSVFDTVGSPEQEKDRRFASVSNVSDLRVPSSVVMDDAETLNSDDFDHIDGSQLDELEHEYGSPTKQKKKKPMLRRFGDMLRRRSFRK